MSQHHWHGGGGDHRENRDISAELQESLDLVVDPAALRARRRAQHDESLAVLKRLLKGDVDVAAGLKVSTVAEDGVKLGGHRAEFAGAADQ